MNEDQQVPLSADLPHARLSPTVGTRAVQMCRELLLAGRWADVLHLAEAASSSASTLRMLDRHVLGHVHCSVPAEDPSLSEAFVSAS